MPENNRKEIHIFADSPNIYASALPGLFDGSISILFTYDEFADAITKSQKAVYTTQICALSHVFIRMGYDIYLYDNGNIIRFGETYLNGMEEANDIYSYDFYYMLTLYKMGILYNT